MLLCNVSIDRKGGQKESVNQCQRQRRRFDITSRASLNCQSLGRSNVYGVRANRPRRKISIIMKDTIGGRLDG